MWRLAVTPPAGQLIMGDAQQQWWLGVHTALEGQDLLVIVAVGREIEAQGNGVKKLHLLGNALLDGVTLAAANAVDADDDPLRRTVVRRTENAGRLPAAVRDHELSFHV